MGLFGNRGSGHPLMIILNAILRFCQFILAVIALGLYAQYLSWENKEFSGEHEQKAITAVVTACLATITALVFGLIPLFTANYFHVAVAFVWDFIVFVLWCAVFGLFHHEWVSDLAGVPTKDVPEPERGQVSKMQAAVWVDLVCLLFWAVTFVMGIVGVFLGRRNRKVG